ncbi:MAG: cytochrome family protein [Reyranellales bacterium]
MTKTTFASAVLAAVVLATAVAAQTPPAAPPPFRPGLGDLMTMFVQPRHIKLGLGGQARNWDYLAYEQHELQEAFERVERYSPKWRKYPIAEMLSLVKEPMAAVEAAIKSRDGARFDVAYGQLTDACNACHRGADHALIAIQVPKASMFPDQNFAPQKP